MRKVIDAQCLVGVDYWLSQNKPELAHTNNLVSYENEIKEIADSYHCIIMPFPSSRNGTYIDENESVLKLCNNKGWTTPVLAFNPYSQYSFEYICKKLSKSECNGIVLWPILCDLDLNELIYNDRFIYVVSHFSCSVTVHVAAGNEKEVMRVSKMNNYSPLDAVNLAKSFPNTKFNLSHCLRLSKSALDIAEKLDNVIIDISGISTHHKWYENGINIFPAYDSGDFADMLPEQVIRELMNRESLMDKLVFGSQFPFGQWYGFGIKEELDLIKRANLTDNLESRLLYKNYENFFGRSIV